jgi:hypothetical protein
VSAVSRFYQVQDIFRLKIKCMGSAKKLQIKVNNRKKIEKVF